MSRDPRRVVDNRLTRIARRAWPYAFVTVLDNGDGTKDFELERAGERAVCLGTVFAPVQKALYRMVRAAVMPLLVTVTFTDDDERKATFRAEPREDERTGDVVFLFGDGAHRSTDFVLPQSGDLSEHALANEVKKHFWERFGVRNIEVRVRHPVGFRQTGEGTSVSVDAPDVRVPYIEGDVTFQRIPPQPWPPEFRALQACMHELIDEIDVAGQRLTNAEVIGYSRDHDKTANVQIARFRIQGEPQPGEHASAPARQV